MIAFNPKFKIVEKHNCKEEGHIACGTYDISMKNKTDKPIQNPCCSFVGSHRVDCPNYETPEQKECRCSSVTCFYEEHCYCDCHIRKEKLAPSLESEVSEKYSEEHKKRVHPCPCDKCGFSESEVSDWEEEFDKRTHPFITYEEMKSIISDILHKYCIPKKELAEALKEEDETGSMNEDGEYYYDPLPKARNDLRNKLKDKFNL